MNPLLYVLAGLNALFFSLRNRVRWRGRRYHEKPAGSLPNLTPPQRLIVQGLRDQYNVHFEAFLNERNALRNYYLLHLLDQVAETWGWGSDDGASSLKGRRVVDVGSKNFYYAPALHAFFQPSHLAGVELDGFHLYRGLYTNASYADFYIKTLPNSAYHVMNLTAYHEPVDILVWFFPFVFKEDVVSWYLPLNCFEPKTLFQHARQILSEEGVLLMVNTGEEEWTVASDLLHQVGFSQRGWIPAFEGLWSKVITPSISLWSVR